MHGFRGFLVGWFALTMAGSQAFALSYAESSSGDLSNSLTAPTSIGSLNLGSNLVSGASSAGGVVEIVGGAPHFPNQDVDVWTIVIDAGHRLDAIVLTSFTFDNSAELLGPAPGDGAFFGFETGGQITDGAAPPSSLTGGALVGMLAGASQGDNVLDDLSAFNIANVGTFGPRFYGSLYAGTYTFWYQEGPTDTTYTLDFEVNAIPEPSTALLRGFCRSEYKET